MSTEELADVLKLATPHAWLGNCIDAKDAVALVMRTMKDAEADRGNPLKISLRAICEACDFSATLLKAILTGLHRINAIGLPKGWQSGNAGNVREIAISFDESSVEEYSLAVAYNEFRSARELVYNTPSGRHLRVGNLACADRFAAEDEERRKRWDVAEAERKRRDGIRLGECEAIAKHRAGGKCGACGCPTEDLCCLRRLYLDDYVLQFGVRDPSWLIAVCDDCLAIVSACYEKDPRVPDSPQDWLFGTED